MSALMCPAGADHAVKQLVTEIELKGTKYKSIRFQCTRCHVQAYPTKVEEVREVAA